jgi:hypothetical protein
MPANHGRRRPPPSGRRIASTTPIPVGETRSTRSVASGSWTARSRATNPPSECPRTRHDRYPSARATDATAVERSRTVTRSEAGSADSPHPGRSTAMTSSTTAPRSSSARRNGDHVVHDPAAPCSRIVAGPPASRPARTVIGPRSVSTATRPSPSAASSSVITEWPSGGAGRAGFIGMRVVRKRGAARIGDRSRTSAPWHGAQPPAPSGTRPLPWSDA